MPWYNPLNGYFVDFTSYMCSKRFLMYVFPFRLFILKIDAKQICLRVAILRVPGKWDRCSRDPSVA